ncbi:MAG TPA: type II toxin-antitoxin system RelE/ParE family toxin [Verrucomicrobiae bacterium]|nr:type II toxin-antitoxin system RelE/ParE family toxin [Verrucomicrobiae bacterium]
MKLSLHRAEQFNLDFDQQYRWYLKEAGEAVAERFLHAVETTLRLLLQQPELGPRKNFKNPVLADIRFFRVERPFDKILVFYRHSSKQISIERLMHGSRDLPRRLTEPPGA